MGAAKNIPSLPVTGAAKLSINLSRIMLRDSRHLDKDTPHTPHFTLFSFVHELSTFDLCIQELQLERSSATG